MGGLTLVSGVYHFSSSAQLTGTLNLNAQGNDNAYWVFQIGSDLTTASNSTIQLINPGSNNGFDDGVFWQVGTSATLGAGGIIPVGSSPSRVPEPSTMLLLGSGLLLLMGLRFVKNKITG